MGCGPLTEGCCWSTSHPAPAAGCPWGISACSSAVPGAVCPPGNTAHLTPGLPSRPETTLEEGAVAEALVRPGIQSWGLLVRVGFSKFAALAGGSIQPF